jgi:2,4-dienoyl-CoA reductase-like NADH-dependent reductase (Old Yellow Enzyme family)
MSRTVAELLAPLAEPVVAGGLDLRNRFALAPMTRRKAVEGVPTEVDADYYRRRADGGAGLVITEGAFIDDPGAGADPRIPVIRRGPSLEGWRSVVDAVHESGSAIVPQLWHLGIQATRDMHWGDVPLRAPSGLDLGGESRTSPLSTMQIDGLIEAYVRSAVLAQGCGFDGVEIHGAHGYLVDQFFWSRTNLRRDVHGGHVRNRARFAAAVVGAIRDAVGPAFPIILRFSQWKEGNYEARIVDTPTELEQLLAPIVEAGVDWLHPSTRRHWEPGFEGSTRSLAGWTKAVTGLPVLAVGSVGISASFGASDKEASEEAKGSAIDRAATLRRQFDSGEFDVVAVGRAMLADAAWVGKSLAGDQTIRPYRRVP